MWSLRPHSAAGGFKTHTEDDGHCSYHAPGWNHVRHPEWDIRESDVVPIIRSHSFAINSERETALRAPKAPARVWVDQGRQCICWTGSAWADRYLLRARDAASGQVLHEVQVYDCAKEGESGVRLDQLPRTGPMTWSMTAITRDGAASEESHTLQL